MLNTIDFPSFLCHKKISLQIAMNFREEDMLAVLAEGGSELSKSELGAFFRKPGHKHFRACGNQVLRNFIAGLTGRIRAS